LKILHTKGRRKAFYLGAVILLFLYAFRNVNQGIDVTDTGYHFSNFLYMSEMDPMWIFSTYLASVLGHFFTMLPGGDTLLGINIYTALIPALLGVLSFVFFTKVLKQNGIITFTGVAIALSLCWCPTTCLYNYLTYLLFSAGAGFLYLGLRGEKSRYMVAAGICLGMNVMVRFPNVAEAALILAVWFACFVRKAKWKEYVQKAGWCLLGYLVGIGVILLQISLQYGLEAYIAGIIRLLGMTSDASDYTLYSMIYNLIQAYIFNGKWAVCIGIGMVLGVLGFAVLPERFTKIKTVGYSVCCLVLIRWFYGQGMFSLAYDGYGAIFGWSAVAIMGALALALWMICSRKTDENEKILSAIVIIIIGITPLGSNNQLYANINHMFPVVPFILYGLQKMHTVYPERNVKLGKYSILLTVRPVLLMAWICVIMLSVQSVIFGNVFVFRDSVPRNTEVTEIPALANMQTTALNAAELEELGKYAKEAELEGRNVLLFGDVPALSAYLRMPFVMSPWPDLSSYSNSTFEAELQNLAENMQNNRPVIIFGADFYDFLTSQEEDKEVAEILQAKYGYKAALLKGFIAEYDYQSTFENAHFVILE